MSILGFAGLAPVNLIFPAIVAPPCGSARRSRALAITNTPPPTPSIARLFPPQKEPPPPPLARWAPPHHHYTQTQREEHDDHRRHEDPRRRGLVEGEKVPGAHRQPVAVFPAGTVPREERHRNGPAGRELKFVGGIGGRKGAGEHHAPLPVLVARLGGRAAGEGVEPLEPARQPAHRPSRCP